MEVIHLIQYGRVHKLFINNDNLPRLCREMHFYINLCRFVITFLFDYVSNAMLL